MGSEVVAPIPFRFIFKLWLVAVVSGVFGVFMPVSWISVGFLVGDEGVRVIVVVVNSDVAVLRILTLVVRSSLEELSTFASLAVTLFAESLGLGQR